MEIKSAFVIPVIVDWLPVESEDEFVANKIEGSHINPDATTLPGVLFLSRKDPVNQYPAGVFDLPGGTVDDADRLPDGTLDPRVTALREFREESGIAPDATRVYPFTVWPKYGVAHFLYFMKKNELGQIHLDPEEHLSCSVLSEVQLYNQLMPGSDGISNVLAIHGDTSMFFLTHGNWEGRDEDLATEIKLWWDPELLDMDNSHRRELDSEVRFDRELRYR